MCNAYHYALHRLYLIICKYDIPPVDIIYVERKTCYTLSDYHN